MEPRDVCVELLLPLSAKGSKRYIKACCQLEKSHLWGCPIWQQGLCGVNSSLKDRKGCPEDTDKGRLAVGVGLLYLTCSSQLC